MKPSLSGTRSIRLAILPLSAVAALFAAGCRTPASQTLLEHENFEQEKRIDDLKDQVDDAEHDLAQCRRENVALKRKLGGTSTVSPSDSPQELTPPDVSAPPEITAPPSRSRSNSSLFQPPKVDRGTEAPSGDSPAPPGKSLPEQWIPLKDPAPLDGADRTSTDSRATSSSYQEESPGAVRIAIVRLLTNGHQYGGHSGEFVPANSGFGDNGLEVAFTARDAANRPVAAEGSLAMVVVDPAISGPEARVARWDFPANELKAHYRQTLFGKAYRFDLLWPHGAPRHERLRLFVRLTTPNGEQLEHQQWIHVKRGVLAPAEDDSNFADAPAPRTEPTAIASATGDYEPDDPAPHDEEPTAAATKGTVVHSGVVHNGAVWKPYR